MKITLCGSIAFYDEMLEVKARLESLGHEVKLPPKEVRGKDGELISVEEYYEIRKAADASEPWIWERKAEAIQAHFDKVEWADVVLITNYDKKGIDGYVGGNTLMEMGVAFHLKTPIYLLKRIPDIGYDEEIKGMHPILIDEDLSLIK